jgi:hypothetical protein
LGRVIEENQFLCKEQKKRSLREKRTLRVAKSESRFRLHKTLFPDGEKKWIWEKSKTDPAHPFAIQVTSPLLIGLMGSFSGNYTNNSIN